MAVWNGRDGFIFRTNKVSVENTPRPSMSARHRDAWAPILVATLFTRAKLRKQQRCPSAGGCIKRRRCVCIIASVISFVKKNGIMTFSRKWLGLEIAVISDQCNKCNVGLGKTNCGGRIYRERGEELAMKAKGGSIVGTGEIQRGGRKGSGQGMRVSG